MSNIVFILGNKDFSSILGSKTNDISSIINANTFEDIYGFISLSDKIYLVVFGSDIQYDASMFDTDNIIVVTNEEDNLDNLAENICKEFGFKVRSEVTF